MARTQISQYSTLIRFWLKEQPAESMEAFTSQAAAALWIEERCFKALGSVFGQMFGNKHS